MHGFQNLPKGLLTDMTHGGLYLPSVSVLLRCTQQRELRDLKSSSVCCALSQLLGLISVSSFYSSRKTLKGDTAGTFMPDYRSLCSPVLPISTVVKATENISLMIKVRAVK
jgi:hypothetical protein